MKRSLATLSLALLALMLAARVIAHDYWLEADSFFLPEGKSETLMRLHLGEALKSESERPLQKDRTAHLKLLSSSATKDLLSSAPDNQTPIVRLTFERAGNYLLAMERKASTIKLDSVKFEGYLAEEGLDAIILERKRLGEAEEEGRERYTRYLKTLLQVGTTTDETFKQQAGHSLEITPVSNPYQLKVGDKFSVRVSFTGRPLSGAQVFAHNRHQGTIRTQVTTTSRDGIAAFTLERPGVWLVRLVHMRRCEDTGCDGNNWESFWGALTFGSR
ncbi:MAG TPA: DUF4198 domain-containing protein [Pyrinomonadaceae bacterium]|jgi:uncharacterized GH25 family protein|nr:DUF4198 domain-containing protein [Pyrinomonadaceae bacterium]